MFADALAAAINPSCAGGNHAAIYVEHQVTGWCRDMLGFPRSLRHYRLQLGGEAFLTSTELRGGYVLRACIVKYRSRREDVDRMLDALRAIALDLR